MSANRTGVLFVLLSGLFFGLIGYFGLSAMNANLSVYTMLMWRFLVSSLFIFILVIPQIKLLTVHKLSLLSVFFYGMVFYSTTAIFYFLASVHLGSGLAMVIFFTYPAFVMLINMLVYRIKISRLYLLALAIITFGMVLLIDSGLGKLDLTGICFSLLSAVLYAIYVVVSKNSPVAPLPSTFALTLGCVLTCYIAAWLDNSFKLPMDTGVWINIAGIGIICTALPIFFLLKGLKYLSATQASILSVLEPVFVLIFGIVLLDERIALTQAIGVTALLCGALLSLLNDKTAQTP